MVVVDDDLIPILDEMYMDLSCNRLEVCLVPSEIQEHANDGGMIRAVCSQNVDWYRQLCADYPCTRNKKRSPKKDYTKIKRAYIMSVLERLIRNKKSKSIYADYLVDVAKDTKRLYDKMQEKDELIYEDFEPWNNQF